MKHSDRRNFLKQSAVLGAIAAAPALTSCRSNGKGNDISGKFMHHVFFWLKQPDDEKIKRDFRNALIKLASVETVRFRHIPSTTNSAKNMPIGGHVC